MLNLKGIHLLNQCCGSQTIFSYENPTVQVIEDPEPNFYDNLDLNSFSDLDLDTNLFRIQ